MPRLASRWLMEIFQPHDLVRINKVLGETAKRHLPPVGRSPKAGDLAMVVIVHDDPLRYELTAADTEGKTLWMGEFRPEELELELFWRDPPE